MVTSCHIAHILFSSVFQLHTVFSIKFSFPTSIYAQFLADNAPSLYSYFFAQFNFSCLISYFLCSARALTYIVNDTVLYGRHLLKKIVIIFIVVIYHSCPELKIFIFTAHLVLLHYLYSTVLQYSVICRPGPRFEPWTAVYRDRDTDHQTTPPSLDFCLLYCTIYGVQTKHDLLKDTKGLNPKRL